MSRTAEQIQRSKARLERAIEFLTIELQEVEKEMALMEQPVSLDRSFFWNYVANTLHENDGISGASIKSKIETMGLIIPDDGFRVFLSRNKTRGNLVTSHGINGHIRWHLSDSAKERLTSRQAKKT